MPIKWKTPFDVSSEEFKTASGEFTRPTYKAVLDKNGALDVKEDGIELTYEKIQSYKDSVDINLIVARYAAGDALALSQIEGSYGDFIEVPSSYMDVLNTVVEARNAYELGDYDVSFEEFINSALKPVVKASEAKESEVVTDEQKSE